MQSSRVTPKEAIASVPPPNSAEPTKPSIVSAPTNISVERLKDQDSKQGVDETLVNGPLENRRCTDLCFFVLFTTFVIAWVGAGLYGYARGDPMLLTYPFDSDGNQCGRPGGKAEDFQYLYWPFPVQDSFGLRVCVKSCPQTYSDTVDCYLTHTFHNCDFPYEDAFSSPNPVYGYVKGIYPSTGFLTRFCVPNALLGWATNSYQGVANELDISSVVKWMADIYTVWVTLLIVAAFALVLAFAYFLFLRYFVGIVIWTSIILILAMVFSVAYVLHWTADHMYQKPSQYDTRKTLEVCSDIVYAIGGLFLLYILYMCKRIRLAIAILKSAVLFLRDVKSALIIPPVAFLLTVGVYLYWMLATLYIYSSGDINNASSAIPTSSMTSRERNLFYFHFFGVLWINAFIVALEQFVLASSVAIWYFAQNSDSGPQRCVSRSVWRAFRYHVGSIAFGALILAIVQFTKWILRYITEKLSATKAETPLLQWLLGVLNCLVSCFERFIKFINRNAYIQIALKSTSFCVACKDAFFLVIRNALMFATLGSIGGVFIFLGKWLICLLASYLGYLVLTHSSEFEDKINSPVFPVIVRDSIGVFAIDVCDLLHVHERLWHGRRYNFPVLSA